MKKFDVYFILFDKKFKYEVFAKTEEEAKQIVRNKIIFHKIVKKSEFKNPAGEKTNDLFNCFNDIFGKKK